MSYVWGSVPAGTRQKIPASMPLKKGDILIVEGHELNGFVGIGETPPALAEVCANFRLQLTKRGQYLRYFKVTSSLVETTMEGVSRYSYRLDYAVYIGRASPIAAATIMAIVIILFLVVKAIEILYPAIFKLVGLTPEEVAAYREAAKKAAEPVTELLGGVGGILLILLLFMFMERKKE